MAIVLTAILAGSINASVGTLRAERPTIHAAAQGVITVVADRAA